MILVILIFTFSNYLHAQEPLTVSHINTFDTTLNPSGKGLYTRFGSKVRVFGNYAAILSNKCPDVFPQNGNCAHNPKVIFISKRVNNEWKFHSKIVAHQDETILDFKIHERFLVLNKLDNYDYWNPNLVYPDSSIIQIHKKDPSGNWNEIQRIKFEIESFPFLRVQIINVSSSSITIGIIKDLNLEIRKYEFKVNKFILSESHDLSPDLAANSWYIFNNIKIFSKQNGTELLIVQAEDTKHENLLSIFEKNKGQWKLMQNLETGINDNAWLNGFQLIENELILLSQYKLHVYEWDDLANVFSASYVADAPLAGQDYNFGCNSYAYNDKDFIYFNSKLYASAYDCVFGQFIGMDRRGAVAEYSQTAGIWQFDKFLRPLDSTVVDTWGYSLNTSHNTMMVGSLRGTYYINGVSNGRKYGGGVTVYSYEGINSTSKDTIRICGQYMDSDGVTFQSDTNVIVTINNSYGADSIINLHIDITEDLNARISLISEGLIIDSENPILVQWLDCGNNFKDIPSENEIIYTPPGSGNYTAIIVEGSCMDTLDCFVYIDDINSVKLFPNPVNEKLFISKKYETKINQVVLVNSDGEEFYIDLNLALEKGIDMSDFRPGIYYLRVISNLFNEGFKILKY